MIEVSSKDPNQAVSILSSIGRFSALPETRGMRDWLKSELQRLDAANRIEMDKTVFRQRQGACQVLEKLFEIADTSDGKIEKIRANSNKKGA